MVTMRGPKEDDVSDAEPSPRPWRVNDLTTNPPSLFEENQHYYVIEAGDGFYDHDTDTGFRLSGFMSDADAALIVRCVNRAEAVEELVRAAKAVSLSEAIYSGDPVNANDRPDSWQKLDAMRSRIDALRAGLAKLTEGET